ncbi:TetR/AcrR family transcriptional regulator [Fulvivirga lutea]|uniref:Helix-turn-helix transcriptional regulator n=1 Tax=Fulvivirga lutea TaxID=2810512 RepID=A0A974WG12_9BACT|nr:helix-turn-helix domain-containing protein [Fulvivirga lutea]QSE97365.1 helix-turn-helix transcriptional regulator [Fulvivirga lutea]
MTEKQEKILNAALELFAEEGYGSTSTSKIAKKAGVSEGLIFRHFTNKEGLLEAISKEGESRLKVLFANIVMESDPQEVINKTFRIASEIAMDSEQSHFWKLQYKLKWETELYDEKKMEPIRNALTTAFEKLGYQNPEQEADILLLLLDGLATRYFLSDNFDMENMIEFLLIKYQE